LLLLLGVSYSLSISDHVSNVISSSTQTIHAVRLLRAHGMDDSFLHLVYQAVIVAKLTYVTSAWCGFATASDRTNDRATHTMYWTTLCRTKQFLRMNWDTGVITENSLTKLVVLQTLTLSAYI